MFLYLYASVLAAIILRVVHVLCIAPHINCIYRRKYKVAASTLQRCNALIFYPNRNHLYALFYFRASAQDILALRGEITLIFVCSVKVSRQYLGLCTFSGAVDRYRWSEWSVVVWTQKLVLRFLVRVYLYIYQKLHYGRYWLADAVSAARRYSARQDNRQKSLHAVQFVGILSHKI